MFWLMSIILNCIKINCLKIRIFTSSFRFLLLNIYVSMSSPFPRLMSFSVSSNDPRHLHFFSFGFLIREL